MAFELELDSLRSSAGRLKAEIMAFNLHDDTTKEAAALVDSAVSLLETAAGVRGDQLKEKAGQPHLDGRRGVVGDENDDDHEEVEEDVEEDDIDAEGKVIGKKTVKKTVKKPKAKAKR